MPGRNHTARMSILSVSGCVRGPRDRTAQQVQHQNLSLRCILSVQILKVSQKYTQFVQILTYKLSFFFSFNKMKRLAWIMQCGKRHLKTETNVGLTSQL